MEHQKRVLIVGLGLVTLFGGILLITRCFEGRGYQGPLGNTVQPRPSSVSVPVVEENPKVMPLVITDPVEDWKQCRNSKFGYEIKYPNDWKTYVSGPWGNISEPCGTTRGPEFVISPEDAFDVKKANFSVAFVDISESGARSLEEYLQKNPGYRDEIYKETLIQEKRAVWVKNNDGHTGVLTYNNNRIFIIRERNIAEESFDLFLSTLQFLP